MPAPVPDQATCIPFGPLEIQTLLREASFAWWIAGGWALDLFLERQTRPHFDIDVAIPRRDQLLAQAFLPGWYFWTTHRNEQGAIELEAWKTGQFLGYEIPGIWARESPGAPWRFEFILHELSDQTWTFRSCDSVRHPLDEIGGISSQNVPYLKPEIALLLKAVRRREVDEQDFQAILPQLDARRRSQLAQDVVRFDPKHPWLTRLMG